MAMVVDEELCYRIWSCCAAEVAIQEGAIVMRPFAFSPQGRTLEQAVFATMDRVLKYALRDFSCAVALDHGGESPPVQSRSMLPM